MVDAADSKSAAERLAGSSPASGTITGLPAGAVLPPVGSRAAEAAIAGGSALIGLVATAGCVFPNSAREPYSSLLTRRSQGRPAGARGGGRKGAAGSDRPGGTTGASAPAAGGGASEGVSVCGVAAASPVVTIRWQRVSTGIRRQGAGCAVAQLVPRAEAIDWQALEGVSRVGITAGASAPEVLVDEVIAAFRARYDVTVEVVETAREDVAFKLPRVLRDDGPGADAAGDAA